MGYEFKISICIPTYNGAPFLADAIESVLKQSFTDYEIVILDDCSIDNTIEIANFYSLKDARIKVFKNNENLGLVGNWNECIRKASGEWVKFLFQDDILEIECLKKMLKYSIGQEWVLASRKFLFEQNITSEVKTEYLTLESKFNFRNIVKSKIMSSHDFSRVIAKYPNINIWGEPSSALIKRKIFEKTGFFDDNFKQTCDLEFWMRIGTKYGVALVHENLIKFRVHGNSTTMNNHSDKAFQVQYLDFFSLTNKLLYSDDFVEFRASTKGKLQIIQFELLNHIRRLRKWNSFEFQFEEMAIKSLPLLNYYFEKTDELFRGAILEYLIAYPCLFLKRLLLKIWGYIKFNLRSSI